jgi:hypothetical protein
MNRDNLRDWVFPAAEPLSKEQLEQQAARDDKCLEEASSYNDPGKVADAYEKLLESENERLTSVEGRLGSTLGLTSITASLLVGGTMALVNGSLSDSSRIVRWIAGFGLLYLSAQIICSTLAGVRGLGRSTWLRPGIEELVPDPKIEPIETAKQRALNSCKRYQITDRNVNFKVTQMAVAHAAIRNFAVGSAAIAVLGFVAVLFQTPGSATVEAIRKDVDLQKLLRGPQGPPGPASTIALPQNSTPCTSDTGQVHPAPNGPKDRIEKMKVPGQAESDATSGVKPGVRSQAP